MQPTTIAPACIPREIQLQAAMFRLEKVENQIAAGYEVIKKYHKTVTVFGSARTQEDNEYYQKARELGAMLAREGYAVVTGGGGGIMEAANRGAKEAGGTSSTTIVTCFFKRVNSILTASVLPMVSPSGEM